MTAAIEYDPSVLIRKVSELIGALLGRGVSRGDCQRALTTEAGQCAWKISQALGPGSKDEAVKKLGAEMNEYFTTNPAYSNLDEAQQYSSVADFTWLQASPHVLLGINDEDNQVNANASEALVMLRGGQKAGSRGQRAVFLGNRGRQTILRVNRIRLRPSTFIAVRRAISNRFGQSKAAFAATTARLLPNKRLPAWIRNQIENVMGNRKHLLDESGLASISSPFLVFGSRAPGVERNPNSVAAIRAGVEWSGHALTAKVEKIVAGQTYNWNTGQVFRPTTFEDN